MSSFFVNSLLFTSSKDKEFILHEYYFRYHYYSTSLKGSISFTEWKDLSPKEIDEIISIQEEINKYKNDAIDRLNNNKP